MTDSQAAVTQTILAQLRQGTADLHESLEAALPLGGTYKGLDRYIQVLQAFRGFFAAWEPAALLAAPLALAPFVRERARTSLLDRDLAALGQASHGPLATDLPELTTMPALLGSMYVLEGSRLGGQSMVRNLETTLGLTPEHGLAFFYGFGPQTGSQWKAFCALVQEQIDQANGPLAIAAARATFLSIHKWMVASGVATSPRI